MVVLGITGRGRAAALVPGGRWSLSDGQGGVVAVVYSPREFSAIRPVTVVLHGRCGAPEHECGAYAAATVGHGWLVCPRGPLACPGGGHRWSSPNTERVIDWTLGSVARAAGIPIETARWRTLIGFSQGALAAMYVAHHAAGQYRELVLIDADVSPDAELLRRAGVQRLSLVAGDRDQMQPRMWAAYQSLVAQDYAADYASLGQIGHAYPADMPERMQGVLSLAWRGTRGEVRLGESPAVREEQPER
jgi:predicted esterase